MTAPEQLPAEYLRRDRPNILIITSERPCGPVYGSQLRLVNIARLLSRVGNVSFVVCGQPEVSAHECEFEIKRLVFPVRSPKRSLTGRIQHEFNPAFVETEGFVASDADCAAVLGLVKHSDAVWIHEIRTANIFRKFNWPGCILDIDDIPSQLYATSAKTETNVFARLNNSRKSLIWRRRESILPKRFNLIAVCSKADQRYLGNRSEIVVIPNGFNAPAQPPLRAPVTPPRIGFIGNLKTTTHSSGIERFIKLIWPQIKAQLPSARLRLVGEGSDSGFAQRGADIDGLGWVSDPRLEISTWSAMVVPLYVGAGTRVKIAEAFSKKCPVVSTSLGSYGYEVVHGEDLLIADADPDFASACVLLAKDHDLGLRLAENAWSKFIQRWTWDAIGCEVIRAVQKCFTSGKQLGASVSVPQGS